MGAPYLQRNLEALATDGRLMMISLRGGSRAEADLGLLMRKRASILASTLRARPLDEKAAIVAEVRVHIWPLIASGKDGTVIERALPMAGYAAEHRLSA